MKRKKFLRYLLFIGAALLVLVIIYGLWMTKEYRKFHSNDPLVWKKEIREFKKIDEKTTYPANSVLFVGSSSIRFWNSLAEDMAPIPVIQRGFGGSKIGDILYWTPDIILSHNVNKIVVFVGTNDLADQNNDGYPADIAMKVEELEQHVHQYLPNTVIYYISITPTPDRWNVWHKADETNKLIKAYAEKTPNLEFLDFTEEFLLPDGTPNSDLFRIDGLHLNEEGYAIWTKRLKPLLSEE